VRRRTGPVFEAVHIDKLRRITIRHRCKGCLGWSNPKGKPAALCKKCMFYYPNLFHKGKKKVEKKNEPLHDSSGAGQKCLAARAFTVVRRVVLSFSTTFWRRAPQDGRAPTSRRIFSSALRPSGSSCFCGGRGEPTGNPCISSPALTQAAREYRWKATLRGHCFF